MGQMRFLVPFPDRLPDQAAERSYVAGPDGIPWRTRVAWDRRHDPPMLVVERAVAESGNYHIPWQVAGRGEVTLSTASLMERGTAYLLPLEIARGTLNRLRNQAADWQGMGLQLSSEFQAAQRQLTTRFAQAVTRTADPAAATALANETIADTLTAMDSLIDLYAEQAAAARQSQAPRLPTFLAWRFTGSPPAKPEARQILPSFNSVMLDLNWRELMPSAGRFNWEAADARFEWCREQGLRLLGGPLLQLDRHHTPDWLYIWEGDFSQILANLVQYVRGVVERYRGRVHVWNCAARMNLENELQLSEEDRLRLVVAVIDEVQRLDPRTPYIVSFEQPWAEYLAGAEHDFSPLHFADALVRGELGLAGLGIEMNLGFGAEGSQRRDILEISRLLDRWNQLGLPLLVFHAVASDTQLDPRCRTGLAPSVIKAGLAASVEQQRIEAEQLLRVVLAKPFLHGYVWQDYCDADPHEYARAGILDDARRPKPLLRAFADLRSRLLT